MLPEPNGQVARICLALYYDFMDKKISKKEFVVGLAYAQVRDECLREMFPESEPYPPNDEIAMILNASPEKKKNIDWTQEPLRSHVNEIFRIRNKNQVTKERLFWAKERIPLSDQETHRKIDDQLALFGVRIAHPESYLEHSVKE